MRIGRVVLALVVVIAIVWWGLHHTKGGSELLQAPVWADLQSVEAAHRGDAHLAVPMLLKGAIDSGHDDVLGLRSNSARFPYVWIVLTTNDGANGVYALPRDVAFTLACTDVRSLQTEAHLDPVVVSALQAHCRN